MHLHLQKQPWIWIGIGCLRKVLKVGLTIYGVEGPCFDLGLCTNLRISWLRSGWLRRG